jgi:hypothetical protein
MLLPPSRWLTSTVFEKLTLEEKNIKSKNFAKMKK